MAVFDNTDKFKRWKYNMVFCRFNFSKNDILEIPIHQITDFSIEENYEEHYFPLVKIIIVLEQSTIFKILKYKNEVKINLRIDKFFYKEDDTKDKSVPKKYINDTFELILDDSLEDMYNSLKLDENKNDYTTKIKDVSDKIEQVVNPVELWLFKPIVSNTKKNINKLLHKCNVSDAISYIASVSKIDNILMTQPDNTEVYDNLLLPPLSVIKSLEFIDNYYGLYKEGSMIFFGLDYTYIIPYRGKSNAYYKGEVKITNIIIPKSMNTNHKNILGSLYKKNDKNNNYIVADFSSLSIQNKSISNDYINANNIQAVDSYDNSSISTNNDAISKNEGFTKIVENTTMNPYYATMYSAQVKGKSVVVSLRLQDFDISMISPNKEFNLIFEDTAYTKKYNGKYIIAGIINSFIKESDYYGLSSVIVLRKMN